MKKQLFSILALLLMAAGSAVAQNENSVNVRELTRNAEGNWVLSDMPDWSGALQVTFYEQFRLDSIPLAWTITVNGTDRTAEVTAYTADEGPDTLGWLMVYEGAAVELVPPTAVKPTVKNVTLVDNSVPPVSPAAEATAEDVGKIIGTDGNIYDDTAAATAAGTIAVAKIIYIGATGVTDYNHGLALALTDENQSNWNTALNACSDKNTSLTVTNATWFLPSKDQWITLKNAVGNHNALRDGFSSVGGTNMVQGYYWSSSPTSSTGAWRVNFANDILYGFSWAGVNMTEVVNVRACLAF